MRTRRLFADTETTGFSADDRIVEIALVECVGRELTGKVWHSYFNPGRQSAPEAIKVHGLTDEFLADKPAFKDKAVELLAFIGSAQLVAHNAAFDVRMLNQELARLRRRELRCPVLDTLELAKQRWPGGRNSLDSVCSKLGIDTSQRVMHGARGDADLLAKAWLAMTRGQDTIELVDTKATVDSVATVDAGALIVIEPSAAELAAHNAYMKEIARA
jgi:DNA polymerase III subunit epsilon